MEVFARPGLFTHIELEGSEALFERLQLAALAPGFRMFGGQLLQVRAHQAGQRSIALNRDLADFPDQIIVQGKRNIHAPIIRETLNKGKAKWLVWVSAIFV
jgi:hypothetical protein